MYYHIHVHTTKGSIGDSIIKIDDYIDKAKELKLDSLVITNHGSLADMYEFYFKCKKNNIKPIIGCEVYEAPDRLEKITKKDLEIELNLITSNHLLLIAKNQQGLKDLLDITSDAHINGFYKKPRTDMSYMRGKTDNLIATSACLGGKLNQLLKQDDGYRKAINALQEYKHIFNEFYLELQPGSFEEQIEYNKVLVHLSKATDTPLVVTNDVHYLNSSDYYAHDAHVKAYRKNVIDSPMIYPDICYYMMTEEEVKERFYYLDEEVVEQAIKNTEFIVSQCNIDIKENSHMPSFDVGEEYSEDTLIKKICYNELNIYKESISDPSLYVDRIEQELTVIKKLGFSGYFLTVRDLILHAIALKIPYGPGRGSVCGSLVAFLLNITSVDPIKYNLLFERFLSPKRKSLPDVDLDFSSSRRKEMFDYALEKYGSDKCALVSTFTIRKARSALRDAGRIFELDKDLVDKVAKLIPQVAYDDEGEKITDLAIKDSIIYVEELNEYSQAYPEWFGLALALEDLPKASSIHAAGTIISPHNLKDYIPLIRNVNNEMLATSLCLDDAESVAFLKYDFLSLATLDVVGNTLDDIGLKFDYKYNLYDDEDTWNLIGSKNTTGLFQISSSLYKQRMSRLKPKNIKELANCLALVRGPCISSGQDLVYMDILEGKREIELLHPFYDDATKDTHGVLIYQESLMKICVNFGFTLEDGYNIMKTVASKKIEQTRMFEEQFYKLGKEQDVPHDIIDKIWQIILDASQYLFNQSHGVSYALLSYASAYLKAHYPLQYMKNLLTNAYIRKEYEKETIQECRRLGIQFLPVDVNNSSYEFTIEDGYIRIGLVAIKSFGENAAEELITNRPYYDIEDVLDKVAKNKCGKRALVPAIFAGMFSSFNDNRKEVYEHYISLLEKDELLTEIKLQGAQSFKTDEDYDKIEELVLGASITSNPINNFTPIGFDDLAFKSKFNVQGIIKKVKKIKTKTNQSMAFIDLETADGILNLVVFPNMYTKYNKLLKISLLVDVFATKDKEDSSILSSIKEI